MSIENPYLDILPESAPWMGWLPSLEMSPWLSVLIQAALLLLSYAFVHDVVRRYELILSLDHFPSFIYLMLLACTMPIHGLHSISVISLLLIVAYASVFGCYHQNDCNDRIFNANFLYVTASFFLPPLLLLLPFLWMLFNFINVMTGKRFLVSLSGGFFAFFVLGGILFLSNQLPMLQAYFSSVIAPFGFSWDTIHWGESLFLGVYIVMYIIVMFSYMSRVQCLKNSVRACLAFLIVTWWVLIGMVICFPELRYAFLMLSYFPFSIMAGHFYTSSTSRFSSWLVGLFLLILPIYYWSYFQ